jgi:secondary thiamine-phosphate synthase enzyme
MKSFSIKTRIREELIDITAEINRIIDQSGIQDGICVIYTPHTTAAITINENADASVKKDMLFGLSSLGLESLKFSHAEGNSAAHIKSSIIGCSETLCIEKGKIVLGTWQGVFFCEFDGPRSREINVQLIGA